MVMDLLIKGLEIPKNCLWCEIIDCSYGNDLYLERPNDCPLVEVKPHGRLIDADKLKSEINHLICTVCEMELCENCNVVWCKKIIENAPTVLEANYGTDNKKKYSSGYPYPSETATSYSKTTEASNVF